jgi:hypothetical protein
MTIDALHGMGLDTLCGGYPAFIDRTRQMLLSGYFSLWAALDG